MIKASIDLQDLRRRIYVKAKAEPSWRFWGLYVHVCKTETLREAYEMAKKNDGAPGVDGVQDCSTLFTEGHRKYGFETAESGGVAVLRDCVGLIEPENIVGEASNSREDARIFSNARCVFA